MTTFHDQRQLVRDRWWAFAAVAWNAYLKHEQGALVVDLANPTATPTYLPLASPGFPHPLIERLVRSYNPEREVVFIFIAGNSVTFGRYGLEDGLEAPPAVYQRLAGSKLESGAHEEE